MSAVDRAAQFSPFAALSGHDAAVKETARLTENRLELDESMKELLNDRLQIIAERIGELSEISVTYFQPDRKKKGGAYISVVGEVMKIDGFERMVIMTDGRVIPIDEIIEIDW